MRRAAPREAQLAVPPELEYAVALAIRTADAVSASEFALFDAEDRRSVALVAALAAHAAYRPGQGASYRTWIVRHARWAIEEEQRRISPLTRWVQEQARREPDNPRWLLPASLDVLREQAEAQEELEGEPPDLATARALEGVPLALDLRAGLAGLPRLQRRIALLHLGAGWSMARIGAAYGRSRGWATRLWREARDWLRGHLEEELPGD